MALKIYAALLFVFTLPTVAGLAIGYFVQPCFVRGRGFPYYTFGKAHYYRHVDAVLWASVLLLAARLPPMLADSKIAVQLTICVLLALLDVARTHYSLRRIHAYLYDLIRLNDSLLRWIMVGSFEKLRIRDEGSAIPSLWNGELWKMVLLRFLLLSQFAGLGGLRAAFA